MRRSRFLLAGTIALLMTASCAVPGQPDTKPGSTVQSMQKSSVQTENAPSDRDQVQDAYDRAVTAVGWFRSGSMPCSGEAVSMKSGLYREVSYAGIESMDDLKNYLRGLFSEKLVSSLFAEKVDGKSARFLEVDGKLYELQKIPENRENTGDVQVLVRKKNAARFEVDVQTQMLAADGKTVTGVKYNAYFYEKQDGKWVFTNFDLMG